MTKRNLLALPEYWQSSVKPINFEAFADLQRANAGPLGLWCIKSIDNRTGDVIAEQWLKNVLTDNGALSAWKNNFNSAGSAVSIFNQIAITTGAGVTTLQGALTSGNNYTSLTVAALPASIASGTSIVIGAGSGTTQTVTSSGTAASGATSITVTSFTASANFAVGVNVAPQPNATDNPTSLSGTVSYSGALSAGAFSYSGTGAGNRQVQITFTFSVAGGATTANYTEAWLVNTNPVSGTNQTAVHLIFNAPASVNSTTSQQIIITEKF